MFGLTQLKVHPAEKKCKSFNWIPQKMKNTTQTLRNPPRHVRNYGELQECNVVL